MRFSQDTLRRCGECSVLRVSDPASQGQSRWNRLPFMSGHSVLASLCSVCLLSPSSLIVVFGAVITMLFVMNDLFSLLDRGSFHITSIESGLQRERPHKLGEA